MFYRYMDSANVLQFPTLTLHSNAFYTGCIFISIILTTCHHKREQTKLTYIPSITEAPINTLTIFVLLFRSYSVKCLMLTMKGFFL